MKIFEREKSDGLAKSLADNKVSVASLMNSNEDILKKIQLSVAFTSANSNQIDLTYKLGILSSIGWNKNTDVFTKAECLKAQATPVDKQVNYMHDNTFIVGHMTDSFLIDTDGNVIDITGDIPDMFDHAVGLVIYTVPIDTPRGQQIAAIVEDINKGELCLSMECVFEDFDYAVINDKGENFVIARTEESCFLTKHLVQYGGTGKYKEYSVGRILKDFTYSGIGIVKKPANDRGVFLKEDAVKFSSQGSIIIQENKEEPIMNEEQVKALEGQIATANQKAKDLESAVATAKQEVSDLTGKLAVATQTVTDTQAKLDEVTAKATASEKELATVKTELETAKASLTEKTTELDGIKLAQAKAARIDTLVKAGLDAVKAEEVYTKWSALADEQFAEVASLYSNGKKDEKNVGDLAQASVESTATLSQATEISASRADKLSNFLSAQASAKTTKKGDK